jgi:uncharacterized protein YcnI
MRRALVPALFAAALLVPAAEAHVTATPRRLDPFVEQSLTFNVPVDGIDPVTSFVLTLSPNWDVEAVEAKPGWKVAQTATTVTWSGGSIPPGELATFTLTGTPMREGLLVFGADALRGIEHDRFVVPVRAASLVVRARDSGTHSLARAALFVAIAAGALAAAAVALVLVANFKKGSGDRC